MKLDPKRVEATFNKLEQRVYPPLFLAALSVPVATGQAAFWMPFVVVGILAVIFSIQLRPEWYRGLEFLIAVSSFFVVVLATQGVAAELAYFSTVAQIIPVLFLVLVVDRRLRVTHLVEIESRLIVVSVYALILAEFSALDALAQGESGDSFSLVTGGLVAAAIAVILPALVEDDRRSSDEAGDADP